jgi:membrane protein
MFEAFDIRLSWTELLKRTLKDSYEDDCLGLAAQLAYYFFLALFPAILFVFALASFFPVSDALEKGVATFGQFAPPEMLRFVTDQFARVANADSGGLLTLGILGAVWSSSAALVAIITALNRAYDIEDARPWWKVRLVAIGLTLGLSVLVLVAFSLVVAGPTVAEALGQRFGFGPVFEWTWKILQWPLAFFLVSTAFGLVYYFAPDAEQDWVWITPGAVLATLLWLGVSLAFRFYVVNLSDFNATYGAVGGVVMLLLWFYLSGLAMLIGAETNAEIEHASAHGKDPGEKVPGERRKIGVSAARAYQERMAKTPKPSHVAAARAITNEDRSLGQLLTELSDEIRTLVRQEVQLARIELGEKVGQAKRGAAFVTAGALLAYGALLAVVGAVVLGLVALGVPPWAAALVGALAAGGTGYLLVRMGLTALKPGELVPQQTIDALKEDAPWLKSQTR